MEKRILKVPSIISKVMTMADGGLRLFVDTQELDSRDEAEIMSLRGDLGVFVFSDQDIKPNDIKNLPKVELEEKEKTPSVRLRATLYVYWDQHKVNEPFDIYYRRAMEKFINSVKEKLN